MGANQSTKDKSQHARFVETARALGCNENEAAFDEKLKAIAKPRQATVPPEPEPEKPND